MGHTNKSVVAVMGLLAVLAGGNAVAVSVTLNGTSVDYTFDADDLGLYGAATVVGDRLVLTPLVLTSGVSAFGVSATSGASSIASSIEQTLNVTVTAHANYQLTKFSMWEQGQYSLTNASEDNFVDVFASLEALDIEGNPNPTPNRVSGLLVPSYDDGSWSATAGVTLPGTGWGGADGVVNSVRLSLFNELTASSSSEMVSIYKNMITLDSMTVVTSVPEAETYAMMLAGLGLIGFMARRTRIAV